jgi:hypothetical protein
MKWSNCLDKFLTAVDLPTCRAPLISSGFLDVDSFQASNAVSICLFMYMKNYAIVLFTGQKYKKQTNK